ncbi:hypothetical protein HK414_19230 [Ramlibacter terrae]|uniref:Uncharacterized protein n=1 Tax=Ramlibacter terrae TaxID=2732511 RepID=A0ABX6P6H3_9BURK|nr:hypothetical protein HK414_19230 [Ramlibacter terrae]
MDHRIHPEHYARLMDAAERRAHALRREAIAAFWSDAAKLAARSLRAAARRVSRAVVPHRLQRG